MDWVLEVLTGLCESEEGRLQRQLEEEASPQERDRLQGYTQPLCELREMIQRLEVQQNALGAGRWRSDE